VTRRDAVGAPVVWRRTDITGLEHFQISHTPDGPLLEGTVVAAPDEGPLRVEYTIECNPAWHTRRVVVHALINHRREHLELVRDDDLRWWRDGTPVPEIEGCVDIDISETPSTNTLPIRRLALGIGESAPVKSAWILFPSMEIRPLPQTYVREAERRYRYDSRGGEFTATLEVDEHGIVLDYPPFWERVLR
jgi:hypothetical protein